MALIELDTRVPLMAQVPQIDFNQLANNTLNMYDTMQQRGQQGILSRLIAQNTKDGQVNLNNALQSVQSNPNQAYQPALINTLTGMIKQQNAEQLKAQQEAEKFKADTAKTTAEAQEKSFATIQNRMNTVNQVWQRAAKSGNAADVLLGLKSAKELGAITPEQYESNLSALTGMQPNDIMRFASGLALSSDKDQAKYLFETPDNILDNKTSADNNAATVGVQKDKIAQDQKQFDKNFELEKQKQWFKENEPVAFGVDINGRKYRSLANGKNVYEKDENGNYIIEQPKGSGQMSPTIQKELFETDDAVNSGQAVIAGLQDAISLNDKSYSGLGAVGRAKGVGFVSDNEEAKNTVLIDNIVTGNALNALKSTFGAAPTEGERKILVDLQGSANLPADQRKAIWERAQAAAKRRVEYNQQKAEALRNGSYTKTTYKPYADAPSQNKQTTNSSSNAVSKASEKWGI